MGRQRPLSESSSNVETDRRLLSQHHLTLPVPLLTARIMSRNGPRASLSTPVSTSSTARYRYPNRKQPSQPLAYIAEPSLRHRTPLPSFLPSYFTRHVTHLRVLDEAPLLDSSTIGCAHGVRHVSSSAQSL
ncbi:hypothetical protein ST47_g10166 [Ascochyta rabiei]|uniref:Uncharacterized protein n=1 Tax=Didymella rabiei TaxID=5454 RepID=A0A162W6V9_DIDRA|nr:hypothetical protein ST47_g10166 [Ascochyta rabiei]